MAKRAVGGERPEEEERADRAERPVAVERACPLERPDRDQRMTKTENAIIKDLDQWAIDKLGQWLQDVVMRFDAIGMEPKQSFAMITSRLLGLAARCAAIGTSLSAAECGAVFAAMIERERGRLKREQGAERHKQKERTR